MSETSLLALTNPYSASKAAAEMMVNAYRKSFKLPVITVRSNNVYGPHQFPESIQHLISMLVAMVLMQLEIIPKFAQLLQRGSRLLVHGDVTPIQQCLYAGDIVDVLDTIFHKGIIGQIYNIASKDEISNINICHKLLELFELPHSTLKQFNKWVEHTEDRPFNDHRYATDDTKLAVLGWQPKTSFDDGIQITADWYRRFREV